METTGCNIPLNHIVLTADDISQLYAPFSYQVPNYFGGLPTNTFLPPPPPPPPPVFPAYPISCYGYGYGMSNYTQTPLPLSLSPSPSLQYVTRLRLLITNQIEYYFCDYNLERDVYLRRLMDDEGWVPVTSIAGFRRVSKLTSDAQFVRDSLMIYSTMVEVQEERLRKRGSWKKWLLPKA